MDNNHLKTENQTESRLTPELLGLVKRSTLENSQRRPEQAINNGLKLPDNDVKSIDEVKLDYDVKPDNDVKSIDEIKSDSDVKTNDEVKLDKNVLPDNDVKSIDEVKSEKDVKSNDEVKSDSDVKTNSDVKTVDVKQGNDVKLTTNGDNKRTDDDDDIKIINEKINVKKEPATKEVEETIEIKLKPEEFILDDDEVGFPSYLKGWVTRGRTIPITKKTWTGIDIDGDDAILETPSQVVPLFIKKPHIFPPREEEQSPASEKSVPKDEDAKKMNVENSTDKKDESKSPKEDESMEKDAKVNDKKGEDKSAEKVNEKKEDDKNKAQQQNDLQNKLTMLSIPDYYKSSAGSFLMGIGLRRCQETFLKEEIKQTQKLIRKEGELDEHIDTLRDQQEQLDDCKAVNSIFTFKQEKCKMCDFKTDSESVMEYHLSIPHITNRKEYKCNFCTFLTRDARVIVYHYLNDHKKPCNIELPLNLYTCPTCNYESNQKAKAANHMAKCVKVFQEDKVQHTLEQEHEHPAITSKLITQNDLKAYEATVQALKPVVMNPGTQIPVIPGLPRGLQQQIFIMQQQQLARQKVTKPKPVTINPRINTTNVRPAIIGSQSTITALTGPNGTNIISNINFAKTNAPQLYHMLQTGTINNNQLLTNLQQQQAKPNVINPATTIRAIPQQPISRTIVPPINPAIIHKNSSYNKPPIYNKNVKETNGGKGETFVICEICDGYIKDLEQLRTHMSWVHKVKIHPKMIASRPPLNCQKCQWRFFTDQGLERHLLGAHGLVTSNMQDLVDQDQDGGRCTICGKAFASKLVGHMSQVHKATLRPAHLSYKCTVCSATFNLYRLFESHVYMVHSSSKRVNDDQMNLLNKKPRTQTHTIEIGKTTNGS